MGGEVNRTYRTLRECTSTGSVSYGIVQPGRHVEDGVPIIRVNNIKDGTLDLADPLMVDPAIDEKHRKTKLEGGEVLLSLVGTTGQCVVAGPELNGWNVARAIAVIRPADGISAEWLTICLKSPDTQHYLDSRANTTVQKTLNLQDVHEVPILTVPEREERYILEWWNTLNSKIELNRRMNATLEGMAQALFKSWFVDFDPVIDNALAAGNPIPDDLAPRAELRRQALANGTVHRKTAKPFPTAFQFTEELGWIPEGWDATAVSKGISVNPSTKLKKGEIAPFADMKALPTAGYAIDGVIEKAYSGGAKFNNGDVLLARITPCLENGKTGVVDFLTEANPVGFGSTEFIVFRSKGDLSTAFIACLARDSNFRKHCEQSMIGSSGRQRVHNSCFDSYHLALPQSGDLLSKFNDLGVPAFAKANRHSNQNKTLTNLRDTLLPKLISGELRIPQAEQMIKSAS